MRSLLELFGLRGFEYPCRTDPDAINVPYKAKSQCHRILKWLAAGQELSAWTLVGQLRATSAPARGREVRSWLRANGFKVVTRTMKQESGARVLFFKLAHSDRARLRAALNQINGSK
jgi:hypothetical protein